MGVLQKFSCSIHVSNSFAGNSHSAISANIVTVRQVRVWEVGRGFDAVRAGLRVDVAPLLCAPFGCVVKRVTVLVSAEWFIFGIVCSALGQTVVWCPHVFFTILIGESNKGTVWGEGWADSGADQAGAVLFWLWESINNEIVERLEDFNVSE